MFYKDSENGLEKGSKFFESSGTVDMIGGIHSDLFHQERLLLNLVDVKIKLIRSKPEFCLQGEERHKVVLEKNSLLVRKVRVSPGVILGHVKALEKETAKYPKTEHFSKYILFLMEVCQWYKIIFSLVRCLRGSS
ncbi:hypothetical protein AVEN_107142-1 [Araneus ventricosus]|uniref:Uncharacterized protein n=1 Tax=Araneus ventricosus TaxID=182803 RepID=A0A4Y1ZR38_ARAVE|nr:hypothetical protein AVEN_107142-1 [Araneus ventricosus]